MKRVAAYCRVSTDKEDQLNSLESQKIFFEEYIKKNSDWDFAGLYIDEGISGTNTNKRTGFRQMIKDAENRKFELLITKEISRFARNTLDSIYYTRKLKSLGIGVIFLNDNINTLDHDSELRLTIMASIAQEESRKTSERVKWGQKRCMERGVVFGTKVFGYNLKNGVLTINQEESEIIRLIFKLYLENGMGMSNLARELESRGISTPRSCKRWNNSTIFKILRNEKYAGDLKQKKSITLDFLTHKKKKNQGEEEFVVIRNHHEPIIGRNLYEAVQKEIERRRTYTFDKSKYSNRYVWSGKIICGACGSRFIRRTRHKGKKYKKYVWQCYFSSRYGKEKISNTGNKLGCNAKPIHESVLEQLFTLTLQGIIKDKDKEMVRTNLEKIITKVLHNMQNDSQISEINSQILKINKLKNKLINLYLEESISDEEFTDRNSELHRQLDFMNENLQKLKAIKEETDTNSDYIKKIKEVIDELTSANNFNDLICKELLDKVIVSSPNNVKFCLFGNINKQFFK